jgi:putative membrane protein
VSTATATEQGWRRLSRRMLLIHPIQELPRAFPALIGVVAAGRNGGRAWIWAVIGVVIPVGLGLARWFTTRYRVTEDRVEVRTGLLRRRLLAVSRDRIRTVDVTSHALHRLLGLSRVTIGTGRSDREGGGSVRLDGLDAADVAVLRDELLHRGEAPHADATPAAPPVPEPEIGLARLDSSWVALAPFTLSGVVAVGAVMGFLANASREADVNPRSFGPLRALVDQLSHAPLALAVAEVVVIGLAAVAVASTVGYVLSFWDFRLTRRGRALHVRRGLITTRETTIEERRLHGVELSEPLLLRMVGGARCIAIATGLRVGRGAERGGSLLLPPAPRAEAERVAAAVIQDERPLRCPLTPHGPQARRRRFTRALATTAAFVAVLGAASALSWWPGWPWQVSLLLLPVAAAIAADRYRSLGHAISGIRLVTRTGSLVRRRSALAREGIIGWNLERTFFQRRAGLATLTATTAAGRQHYEVIDVEVGEALRVADALLPSLLEPFVDRPQAVPERPTVSARG